MLSEKASSGPSTFGVVEIATCSGSCRCLIYYSLNEATSY